MKTETFAWIAVACMWLSIGAAVIWGGADASTFGLAMITTVVVAFFQ